MSERRHEAVPVMFRVLEREGAPKPEALAWLAPLPEEVRPVEFGAHRGASAKAWIPRAVGEPRERSTSAPANDVRAAPSVRPRGAGAVSSARGASEPTAPAPNLPVANTPVTNVPVANVPVANVPVANAPVANAPVANVPVADARGDGDLPSASGPMASGPMTSGPMTSGPMTSGPSANERPSLAAPAAPPALLAATEALATARTELLAHAEGELVELAVEIARSILGAELDSRPELHRALARAGLDVLGGEVTPRVRLSPESFDAIVTATGSRSLEAHGQRIELEADPSIRGPGALLDAGSSSVDGRLETRLERVRAALLAARRGAVIGEAA